MKGGPCMCSTFKAFNLTYLHVISHRDLMGVCLCVIQCLLNTELCRWEIPEYCRNGRGVTYILNLLHACTNVPLSSAQLPNFFQQPLLIYKFQNKQLNWSVGWWFTFQASLSFTSSHRQMHGTKWAKTTFDWLF